MTRTPWSAGARGAYLFGAAGNSAELNALVAALEITLLPPTMPTSSKERTGILLGKDAHLLVIGGARGLGFELARTASEQGVRVTITRRDAHVAAARATELGPSARGPACDLSDAASLDQLFTDIDVVDHLVLTAIERDRNTAAAFRADAAARMMLIKTVGYANAVAHALPKLDPHGSVVLFSGLSMWRPFPGATILSMANAAILGLVNSLAVEIAPVRVNAITPGTVAGTEAIDNADAILTEFFEGAAPAHADQTVAHSR